MVKKFLVLLFCLLSLTSVVALAHDGPFPMFMAVGTWSSETGLFVVIEARQISSDGVEVFVSIKNDHGQIVAEGSALHNLSESDIRIVLKTQKGSEVYVTLEAGPEDMELQMNLGQAEERDAGRYILRRR